MVCGADTSFSSLNLLHLSHPPPTHVENNRDSPPGTIDLHGLYVKEAIEKTEQAIMSAQANRQEELRVIVGKGIHSPGHHAKIKPAVEGLMQKWVTDRTGEDCADVWVSLSCSLTSFALSPPIHQLTPISIAPLARYNLSAHLDPHNTGVLIVDLDGNERGTRTRDAGGLIDSMDKNEGTDCVIM
jgi:hypothetical protein